MSDFFNKKAVKVVSNVLSSLILIISIIICAVVIISAKSSTGVAKLGNRSFLSVKTDSMSPTFDPGDLIIIRRYNRAHIYKPGDVISFVAYADSGAMFINTHRIVKREMTNQNVYSYTTKGDNSAENDKKKVSSSKILGEYTGKKITGAGKVFDLMQSSKGVLYFVVLPAAVIVVWQLLAYLSPIMGDRRRKAYAPGSPSTARSQSYPPATEDEKETIIREYLARQQAEEAKKQQIIEEYLAKKKEEEEQQKAKAEEAKIKAIIAEFLAQQKAAESGQQASDDADRTDQTES